MLNFITTYSEHICTVLIAINVFLCARNSAWNWPVGLIAVTVYGLSAWFLFGLYADALMQIFYFATGVIGWWYWIKGKGGDSAPVTDWGVEHWVPIIFVIILGTGVWGNYLDTNTDSVVPYLDSFTTITCIIAQIGLMLRKRGSWMLWTVANVVYVFMFHIKGLNILAVEYAVFTINAAYGYYVWTKEMKKQCLTS